MNYRFRITNMDEFDLKHEDYGVILAEEHPEVQFSTSNVNQTVDTYLWYPYELGKHPTEFADYHREKLAITDPNEAQALINHWNREFQNNKLKKVAFSKVFTIAKINFGVIDLPNSKDVIVMRIGGVGYPYQKTIHAGRGGNVWQYLQPSIKPTHEELQAKFNLNKTQRDKFIKKW